MCVLVPFKHRSEIRTPPTSHPIFLDFLPSLSSVDLPPISLFSICPRSLCKLIHYEDTFTHALTVTSHLPALSELDPPGTLLSHPLSLTLLQVIAEHHSYEQREACGLLCLPKGKKQLCFVGTKCQSSRFWFWFTFNTYSQKFQLKLH